MVLLGGCRFGEGVHKWTWDLNSLGPVQEAHVRPAISLPSWPGSLGSFLFLVKITLKKKTENLKILERFKSFDRDRENKQA